MTTTLRDHLHNEADAVEFAPPNIDSIIRAGNRRVRRRRAGVGIAAVAAVAAVAAGVLTAISSTGQDNAVVPATPNTLRPSWADGRTIHIADETIQVDHPIETYVRTIDGFAYLAADTGRVFLVRGGDEREIGQSVLDPSRMHLVGDSSSPFVGFVEPGARTAVIWDIAAGTGTNIDRIKDLYAIDGGTAYWRDDRGVVRHDLHTGDQRVMAAGKSARVTSVQGDLIAFTTDAGARVGTSWKASEPVGPRDYVDLVQLSPDGSTATLDADVPSVWVVDTGQQQPMDLDGRSFGTAYEWLDNETLAVLAGEPEGQVDILTCKVTSGSCTVVAENLGTFSDLEESFALPVGYPIG